MNSQLQLRVMQVEEHVDKLVSGLEQAKNREAAKALIGDLRATTQKLFDDVELPVGSHYFPFCEAPARDDRCAGAREGAGLGKIYDQPLPAFVSEYRSASGRDSALGSCHRVGYGGTTGASARLLRFDSLPDGRGVDWAQGHQPGEGRRKHGTDLAKAAGASPLGRGIEKPNLEELTDAFYVAAGVAHHDAAE